MPFSAEFAPKAAKFVKKLDKQIKPRIRNKILRLQIEPFPPETVRVEEYKDEKVFRVRVGDYRILYSVDYEEKTIIVINVDKRGRVY